MAYREGGYRIEEKSDGDGVYYQIRFKHIEDDPLSGEVIDNKKIRWRTEKKAIKKAKELLKSGFGR